MPEHHPLAPASPWVEVVATEGDWDAADPHLLRTIYAQLVWIRVFEQYVLDLASGGLAIASAETRVRPSSGAATRPANPAVRMTPTVAKVSAGAAARRKECRDVRRPPSNRITASATEPTT